MNNFSNLSIIIPAINERQNLEKLIFVLNDKYPGSHIFIADDGSTDGTDRLIKDIISSPFSCRVYLLMRNRNSVITNNQIFNRDSFYKDKLNIRNTAGLTASVLDTVSLIPTDYFVVIDADFQHPPDLVGEMYDKLSNSDLAAAYRQKLSGFPFYRKLMTKTGNFLASLALPGHSRVNDPLSGAFGGNRKKLEPFMNKTAHYKLQGFKVLFDLLKIIPEDIKITQAGYDFNMRKLGESKISIKHLLSFYSSLFDEEKRKFITGISLVSLLAVSGIILALIFGDLNITSALRNFAKSRPTILKTFEFITDYGNPLYYIIFLTLIITGSVRKNKRLLRVGVLYLLVQLIASVLITGSLKIVIGRPRPGKGFEFQFLTDSSKFKSFPSGHTTDAFASAGVMWGFLHSYLLSFLSFFYSALIGISRIFVGSHYFVDVIAGMVIGFVTGLVVIYRKLNR